MMKVRLRILHGKLQDKQGHDARAEVKVRGPKFVIGSAEDCSLCCRSRSVSPHHCEISLEPSRAVIRPLAADNPTVINGQAVEQERVLQAGDQLRVGRLEFEVLIEPATPAAGAVPAVEDAAAEKIGDLLAEADERERAFRKEHPELRYLHLEAASAKPPEEPPPGEADQEGPAGKRKKKPGKLPGKLPPPPPRITEDSEEAAEEALRKLFGPRHRGR